MGQSIEVMDRAVVDEIAIFGIDRGLTGMDGYGFDSAEEADAGTGPPALLAERLFGGVDRVDRVFVSANDVLVQRTDGWSDDALDTASSIIADLFRHYPE